MALTEKHCELKEEQPKSKQEKRNLGEADMHLPKRVCALVLRADRPYVPPLRIIRKMYAGRK